MTRPIYGIEGEGWQVSFQRHVAGPDTISPNRGGLPCHVLEQGGGVRRVLVPLPVDEALWVAWTVPPGTSLAGRTGKGEQLRIIPVVDSVGAALLLAADAVYVGGRLCPIGRGTVVVACTPAALARASLHFTLTDADGQVIERVAVIVGTSDLYEKISGCAAPAASSPGDAYGGWRLP